MKLSKLNGIIIQACSQQKGEGKKYKVNKIIIFLSSLPMTHQESVSQSVSQSVSHSVRVFPQSLVQF